VRKPTRLSLKRKLDKKVSELIRKKGRCERCGNTNTLQVAHIFSRSYNNLRYDFDNLLCLCARCHFWAHKNPLLFSEFVKKHLGKERYSQLIMKSTIIKKRTIHELQELLDN